MRSLDQLAVVRLVQAQPDAWYAELVGATVWVRSFGKDWVLEQDYLGLGVTPWRCFYARDVEVISRVLIH